MPTDEELLRLFPRVTRRAWAGPTTVCAVLTQRSASPQHLYASGRVRFYLVTDEAARRVKYVGMTYGGSSICERIRAHCRESILGPADLVWTGNARTNEPRLEHTVEILLQKFYSERGHAGVYNAQTRTFDELDEGEEASDVLGGIVERQLQQQQPAHIN